jgi:hypothetical protein
LSLFPFWATVGAIVRFRRLLLALRWWKLGDELGELGDDDVAPLDLLCAEL